MSRKYGYDLKCLELADHFLSDLTHLGANREGFAQHIQDAVETWIAGMPETGIAPCPFCGGAAERVDIEEPGDNFGGSYIGCTQCNASSQIQFDRKETLERIWNARKP